VVQGRSVWLRVSRIGATFAYHASDDGRTWKMIRHFALTGGRPEVQVGFEAQAPTGAGCAITFDEVRYEEKTLTDLRDGS
jgi:regulation of enolase protein 1 (concanavalin A-like superfamily)